MSEHLGGTEGFREPLGVFREFPGSSRQVLERLQEPSQIAAVDYWDLPGDFLGASTIVGVPIGPAEGSRNGSDEDDDEADNDEAVDADEDENDHDCSADDFAGSQADYQTAHCSAASDSSTRLAS